MDRHLYLVFGTHGHSDGWLVGIGDEPIPEVGAMLSLVLPHHLGETMSITAEVRYRTWVPGEPLRVYVYGGPALPPASVREALQAHGCVPMSESAVDIALDAALNAPTIVDEHDVLLVWGSISNYQCWQIQLACTDSVIPVFGQRVWLPLSDMTTTEWSRLLPTTPPSDRRYGLAQAVVFYAAKADTGVAQVGVWVQDSSIPESVTGFELLSSGWRQLGSQEFRAEDFDVWQRIDLAERTTLFAVETQESRLGVDFEIARVDSITADELRLLPVAMQHYTQLRQSGLGLTD